MRVVQCLLVSIRVVGVVDRQDQTLRDATMNCDRSQRWDSEANTDPVQIFVPGMGSILLNEAHRESS